MRTAGVGFRAKGQDPVMVGSGLLLMPPPCRGSPPQASDLAAGSDGGSADSGLGLGDELLESGLGLGMLGTCEV